MSGYLVGRCLEQRLPFEPLEQYLRERIGEITLDTQDVVVGASVKRLAVALGTHPRQIYRWRDIGVTWVQADVLAVQLGEHPWFIWHELWWEAVPEEAMAPA